MSAYQNVETLTFEAGADLSAGQYHFVKLSSGQVVLCSVIGEDAVGVLFDKPAAQGRAGKVAIAGIVKVTAGAAVAQDALVMTNASGRAITATATNVALGTALKAASADGEVIPVLLFIPHETQ